MNVQPHDRFSLEVTLTPDVVAEYARAAGDSNPVHFDAAFAAQTHFYRLRMPPLTIRRTLRLDFISNPVESVIDSALTGEATHGVLYAIMVARRSRNQP